MAEMTDDPQAAPGDLELVRGFVNSRDVEKRSDDFSTPEALRAWLLASGLLGASESVTAADLELARATREAVRSMLRANSGEPPDDAAIDLVNEVSRTAGVGVRFGGGDDVALVPATAGVVGSLGHLLAIVANAMSEGMWNRLKVCRNDECALAFYDHARNRSGKWCSMADCGNLMKARAFRARHTEGQQS
jgi:predicted RNA-binding Zn ribbon-like protein